MEEAKKKERMEEEMKERGEKCKEERNDVKVKRKVGMEEVKREETQERA